MKIGVIAVSLALLFLISSCQGVPRVFNGNYEYELGLGYGFLGKQVQVSVDGVPVLFLVGNEEMETFAQMQGTNILYSGKSRREEVTVSVSVDGDPPLDQIINLGEGKYIHIYLDKEVLSIYNTSVLIYE
jgi:hypothetical protein